DRPRAGSDRAGRRWPLRPAADAARRAGAHPGRRLLALARPYRRREGSRGMTITIGLPSKGRMKEDSSAVLARAGFKVIAVGNDRSYRGRVEGREDIEIAFLSA